MEKRLKTFEDEICPSQGELLIDDDLNANAEILDEEMDVIKCSFNNDDCVEIDTSNYQYITLSYNNLETLMRLIIKAEKHYKKTL